MTYSLTPHKTRPIRFLELWDCDGWKVKIYGIRQGSEKPDLRYVEIAKSIASRLLPQPAVTEFRYGIGIITVHQAEMFHQILFDWWERENELRHHVFKANPEAPETFENITATGEAFCIWELRVIAFEREAWLHTMLSETGAGMEKYLSVHLNVDA